MNPSSIISAWKNRFPNDHLLRLIDRYIDLSFVRERLKRFYSWTGRPSIDPEVLLRLLLVGYLYGITSERRLLEEVRMHLAYRWFTRLDFGQEIPDHFTFSKNRHGRFRQSSVFREVFEEIVRRVRRQGWWRARIWRWTGPWWEPTPADKAESRESDCRKRRRSHEPCGSIWSNSSRGTQSPTQRWFRLPIRMRFTQLRVVGGR